MRAEWNPNYGDQARVLPGRYGLSYTHDVGPVSAKLRASYGRSTRPPDNGLKLAVRQTDRSAVAQFGSYDHQLANPELEPEYQQGGEGGVELYFGQTGSLIVTRYNQTVDNLILGVSYVDSVRGLLPGNKYGECSSSFVDAEGYCYKQQQQNLNVGSIRNQGWELQGSLNTGPFATHGTYSWTKSRILGITPRYRSLLMNIAFEPGRPMDLAPEHSWAVNTTYTRRLSMVSLSVNGTGMLFKQRDDLALLADENLRFPNYQPRMGLPSGYRSVGDGYATADLNAMHQLTRSISLVLQVQNLTDYYANDYDARFSAIGRQSRLGFRWRLN
jgi:outer membrane receptor protein involved in Fe transport